VAADEIVEKFKRIVPAKHGKLELSVEGRRPLSCTYKSTSIFYTGYVHRRRTH